MNKVTQVLITNRSFREIRLETLDIGPFVKKAPYAVADGKRIQQIAQQLYPTILVVELPESDTSNDTNDDINKDSSKDTSSGITLDNGTDTSDGITTDTTSEPLLVVTLELSTNVEKSLLAHELAEGVTLTTVEQLTQMTEKDVIDVKGIANAGLAEIKEALDKRGLSLKGVDNE